ncbi:MAG: hypothetical protein U0Y82_09680 [Thermoleophilia bacterium]
MTPPITFKFTGVANAIFKWDVRNKLTNQLVNGVSGTTTAGTATITAMAPGGYYFEVAQTASGLTGPYASSAFLVQTVLRRRPP